MSGEPEKEPALAVGDGTKAGMVLVYSEEKSYEVEPEVRGSFYELAVPVSLAKHDATWLHVSLEGVKLFYGDDSKTDHHFGTFFAFAGVNDLEIKEKTATFRIRLDLRDKNGDDKWGGTVYVRLMYFKRLPEVASEDVEVGGKTLRFSNGLYTGTVTPPPL